MEKSFQTVLCLFALATLVPANLGMFEGWRKEIGHNEHFAESPLGKMLLLREGRDVVVNETGDIEVVQNDCRTFGMCMENSRQMTVVNILVMFEFDRMVGVLPRWCDEEPICHMGQCDNEIMAVYAGIFNGVFRSICDDAPKFDQGVSCWSREFRNDMSRCAQTHRRAQDTSQLLACFAEVPKGLEGCTGQDADLVARTTNALVRARAALEFDK